MSKSSVWPTVAVALAGVLVGGTGGYLVAPQNDVVVPTVDQVANAVVAKLPNATAVPAYNDTQLRHDVKRLSDEVLKDDLKEAKAAELVSDELASRDFKRALQEFLNDELDDSQIENYKDIKSIVVTDSDYTVSGDTATVELTLKVRYFLDEDSDDEDKEAAKVKVTLTVSDLDEDEEYVDAEVDNYSENDFDLVKFYDN